MKNEVYVFVLFSILIEGIITYINQIFIDKAFSWKILISIFLGVLIAISYRLDLPKYFEVNSDIPYIGCILTGILLSRGSNYIFDLLKSIGIIN